MIKTKSLNITQIVRTDGDITLKKLTSFNHFYELYTSEPPIIIIDTRADNLNTYQIGEQFLFYNPYNSGFEIYLQVDPTLSYNGITSTLPTTPRFNNTWGAFVLTYTGYTSGVYNFDVTSNFTTV